MDWVYQPVGVVYNYISDDLNDLINRYQGLITCVCFMGGDQNLRELSILTQMVQLANLKVALYTGSSNSHTISCVMSLSIDYIKYGPYIEKYGAINNTTTNQVMLKRNGDNWENITYRFQK